MGKEVLQEWLIESLRKLNGSANIVEVCKSIWNLHEDDLRRSGDLFYTWQYDVRWAANVLRTQGVMKSVALSPKGRWELA